MAFNRGVQGIARGEFRISTADVSAARQTVDRESRAMTTAFVSVGQAAQRGASRANAELSSLQQQAKQTSGAVEGIFSAAFLASGLQAARNLQRVNSLFGLLSGSQERVNANMESLNDLAKRTGQPISALKESAVGLLPAIGRANVELSDTISIAQRLAVLDPFQGFQGSTIALKEFLGGSTTSLFQRFELSRERLNQIRQDAQGNTQALIEGLSEYIDEIGLTEEALAKMNREGVTAFENAGAAAQQAIGQAFQPALQVANSLAQGFTDVAATNPGLVNTAVSIAGITAALTAMNIAATQGRRALSQIGGGAGIGRAAGGLLAGGIGLEVGLAGARGLAAAGVRSGDLGRVAAGEDPREILAERIKQIVGGLALAIRPAVQTMLDLGALLNAGVTVIGNAVNALGASLALGVAVIESGFGKIQEAIGNVLIGLADALSGLFDTTQLRQSGQANQQLGQSTQQLASQRAAEAGGILERGIGLTPEQATRIATRHAALRQQIDDTFRGFEQGVVSTLFPAIRETQEQLQQTANPFMSLTEALRNAKPAFDELQKESAELTEDFKRQSQEIAEARSIADARQEFDTALSDARRRRDTNIQIARQDADFYSNRARQFADFNAGLRDLEVEGQRRQIELVASNRREEVRRLEDHGRRLAQIEAETRVNVLNAAARLDARSVFDALQSGAQAINQETSNFDIESQRREEDFQLQLTQLQTNLQRQANERTRAFQQQQADQLAQFNQMRQRQLEDNARQLADEQQDREIRFARLQEDRAREDQLRGAALQRRLTELRSTILAEAKLGQALQTTISQTLAGARSQWTNFVQSIANSIPRAQTYNPPGTSYGTFGGFQPFAAGGRPPLNQPVVLNDRGLESAFMRNQLTVFTDPATIFPADETRRLLAGGAGAGHIGPISIGDIVLGDIGNRSDSDVIGLVRDGINQALMELFNRG